MNDSALPEWPTLYPVTAASGWLKSRNEDFCVHEIPLALPCGDGEHIWLEIEKSGVNTGWIAKQLADIAGVKEMDVGYAGLKDRHAITRQWFSIYLPRVEIPDFSALEQTPSDEQVRILQVRRHSKKLRRGELLGNRFEIRLRDIVGETEALERNLSLIQQGGVPNYFGEQRFGHQGGNIDAGRKMLSGELSVKHRGKKSIYLSAVRSLIFNEVLAQRIRAGNVSQLIDGDVASEQIINGSAIATAPLWGRGRLATSGEALALETDIANRYPEVCDGLEHRGLKQERRALLAWPEQFSWQWLSSEPGAARTADPAWRGSSGKDLALRFSLASGYYATSVIRELLTALEPTPAWQLESASA